MVICNYEQKYIVVDIYGIMFSNKLDTIYILILMHDPTFLLLLFFKLLKKQMWFFFKIIFSFFWALQFPNLLLPHNFDPFSYMGYIYIYSIYIWYISQTTYFCKEIRHKIPYIYGNSYMGFILYISQTTYVCKEIENRTKIK